MFPVWPFTWNKKQVKRKFTFLYTYIGKRHELLWAESQLYMRLLYGLWILITWDAKNGVTIIQCLQLVIQYEVSPMPKHHTMKTAFKINLPCHISSKSVHWPKDRTHMTAQDKVALTHTAHIHTQAWNSRGYEAHQGWFLRHNWEACVSSGPFPFSHIYRANSCEGSMEKSMSGWSPRFSR